MNVLLLPFKQGKAQLSQQAACSAIRSRWQSSDTKILQGFEPVQHMITGLPGCRSFSGWRQGPLQRCTNSNTKISNRSKIVQHLVTVSRWVSHTLTLPLWVQAAAPTQRFPTGPAHTHSASVGAGHSLGGFTAACSAIFFKDILRVTTFESPGLTSFYHSLARQEGSKEYWQQRVVNYLSVPNPINTCQRHLGLMIR